MYGVWCVDILILMYCATGMTDRTFQMEACPYETVALGYSEFCSLFTEKEWKGYEHRWDLYWYYSNSFGYPLARAQGKGWVQELLSRLTHSKSQMNKLKGFLLDER